MVRVSDLRERFESPPATVPANPRHTFPQRSPTSIQPQAQRYGTTPGPGKMRSISEPISLESSEAKQETRVDELNGLLRGKSVRPELNIDTFVPPTEGLYNPFRTPERKGKGKEREDDVDGSVVPKLETQKTKGYNGDATQWSSPPPDLYFTVSGSISDPKTPEPDNELPTVIRQPPTQNELSIKSLDVPSSPPIAGFHSNSSAVTETLYHSSSTYAPGTHGTPCPDNTYRPAHPLSSEIGRTPLRYYVPTPPPGQVLHVRRVVNHRRRGPHPRTPPSRLPADYRADTAFSYERPPTATPFYSTQAPTLSQLFPDADLPCAPIAGTELEYRALRESGEGRKVGPYRTAWPEERFEKLEEVMGMAKRVHQGRGWVSNDVPKTDESQRLLDRPSEGSQNRDYEKDDHIVGRKKCRWWKRWYCRCENCRPPVHREFASSPPMMSGALPAPTPERESDTPRTAQSTRSSVGMGQSSGREQQPEISPRASSLSHGASPARASLPASVILTPNRKRKASNTSSPAPSKKVVKRRRWRLFAPRKVTVVTAESAVQLPQKQMARTKSHLWHIGSITGSDS
jgi:hypothetical protein